MKGTEPMQTSLRDIMPEGEFRKFARRICRDLLNRQDGSDELARRERIAAAIAEHARGGDVPVYEWGRDCDMAEGDSMRLIPASTMAFIKRENIMYDGAEGPCYMGIRSFEDYAEFHPTFRDRALEAFEDGHPHCIYLD